MSTRYAAKHGPNVINTIRAIQQRRPFDAGNLHGEAGPGCVASYGILPRVWREDLRAVTGQVDYVVYSYATPIAWHTPDGWVMPQVSYSASTGPHQANTRTALEYEVLDAPGSYTRYTYGARLDADARPRITTLASIVRAAEVFA